MFFSRHLYIVILCYVLLILGVAGTGLVLIVTHTGIIIGCLIIIISFFITGALVKRLNKSNAKLKLFFDAIEDKENMIQFNEYSGDREMNALSRSLNRINELLGTAKSDSQKQKNFIILYWKKYQAVSLHGTPKEKSYWQTARHFHF